MTEKELRRLSRRELLEMLITRTMENERLTEELQQARKELSDRKFIQEHAGSMAEAKARGKVRMEGKDYIMRDGDVVEFRFNV